MRGDVKVNREKNKIVDRVFIFIGNLLIIFVIGSTIYFVNCELFRDYLIKDDVWGPGIYQVALIGGEEYSLAISCTGRGPDVIGIKIVDGSTSEIIMGISRQCLYCDDIQTSMYYYADIPTFTCQKSGRYDLITTASDSKRDYQIRFVEKPVFGDALSFFFFVPLCLFYGVFLMSTENDNHVRGRVARYLCVLSVIAFFVYVFVAVIPGTLAEVAVVKFQLELVLVLILIRIIAIPFNRFLKYV